MPPKRTHATAVTFPPAQPVDVQTTPVRERRLRALAVFGNLGRLPELVRKRRRLVSSRNRRKLADGLRRTAAAEQPPRRFDCCPVLADRVAAVRYELLLLADELQRSTDPDPASVALTRELLTSGCSPLYNANVPAEDLHATLARARAQIAPGPAPHGSPTGHAHQATQSDINTRHRPPATSRPATQAVTRTSSDSAPGVHRRWRERSADRKRRVLVKWLRRTANHTDHPHPVARRRQTLLPHRAGAVRSELLQIAAALEHTANPNPASLTELHQLLANGCDSPLYNPDIHISELRATIHYLRAGLLTHDLHNDSTPPPTTTSAGADKRPAPQAAPSRPRNNASRPPRRDGSMGDHLDPNIQRDDHQ
jgi:hypothetical protein